MTEKKIQYNPDVLDALANLSSDEVFTPPEIANQMFDLLPNEIWSDSSIKILDPACKSGVFLREAAKRFIKGLEKEIPDLQERINHIMTKQLFGIGITNLTSLLSRRSLYCSKNAKYDPDNRLQSFSICTEFEENRGNIRFDKVQHEWKNGNCIHCGASQSEYERDEKLETHAYKFIHSAPEEINALFGLNPNMRFDVIIGNPPYQLSTAKSGGQAIPIYNKFIEKAKQIGPRYLSMIIPCRRFTGGMGLNDFRDTMMNDTHLSYIKDFEDASVCFPGVHIDSGVCYFLLDSNHNGKAEYVLRKFDGSEYKSNRYLKSELSKVVIRDERQISIIEKIKQKDKISFSSIVSNLMPYGIDTTLFNHPENYKEAKLSIKNFKDSCKIYGVKGIKGGAKRESGYIMKNAIKDNTNSLDKYKIFFSATYSGNAMTPPEPILGEPNTTCTSTFLSIGPFETKEQQENCNKYIHTTFFKVLLSFRRGSIHVTKDVFDYIPLQEFSKPRTDEELYAKYNLTQEEIDYIETMIKPMD